MTPELVFRFLGFRRKRVEQGLVMSDRTIQGLNGIERFEIGFGKDGRSGLRSGRLCYRFDRHSDIPRFSSKRRAISIAASSSEQFNSSMMRLRSAFSSPSVPANAR